jgi:CBS domain-containing protein
MRLSEIMAAMVETVPPDLPADIAWELLRRRRIHHLVVTAGHQVVGVISERDLGGRSGASIRQGRTVADLMTTGAVTATPTTTVKQAANLLRGRSIGCLPVVRGARLIGIITVSDLLELIGRGAARPVVRRPRPVLTRKHGKQLRRSA